ncbi:hypothetical protein Ahy_A05g025445 isoform A [Arachis hypogaea]|uniref:Transposase MuDR plant domain-containing protein n=1 Tax=Arachis hypogaea TaxID=3818 RepID=A0A445D8P7_ARAHY|nr:hypothetical protein Ahy_A05g025445 isoform A [Arachis hypogaea]
MTNNNPFIVVLLYPNCRMINGDNGVTFECQDPILFRTQRVETLSDSKCLILSKIGETEARKIGRVAYRLLAPMEHEAEEGEEESDEDYMADSGDNESSDGGDEDEFVLETLAGAVPRHVLPPPHPIPTLSAVPSHYHSVDLDTMHERIPVSDTCGVDYNLDGGMEFRVGHRFKSREAVLQGVKNYSICKSAEYRVIKSNRLKYLVQWRQVDSGCQWSLRVALRQNLRYW